MNAFDFSGKFRKYVFVGKREIILGLLLGLGFFAQAAGKDTGTLEYPAENNLDFREGTIEFWIKLGFDPAQYLPSTREYRGLLAPIFQLSGEEGFLNASYFAGMTYAPKAGLVASLVRGQEKMGFAYGGEFVPKKDEWHHLAVTWKGRTVCFYVDGQEKGKATCLEYLYQAFGAVGGKPISLGDAKWHKNSRMTIDEFRLSATVRKPGELGFHGQLKPDISTRILDPFECDMIPDGRTPTPPTVIYSGAGGIPSKQCCITEGKFGRGLAFFRKDP